MDRFYRGVRAVARFWLWFLFKSVDARHPERVPVGGPILLCVNHPNNFIDSLVVGSVVRRKVHYLATASMFRNPLMARFLLACGAIPVYRQAGRSRQDGQEPRHLRGVLRRRSRAGRLVAIYPEGTTHAEARVQRIKTGAARIALGYEAEPSRRAADDPGRALVRGAQVVPQPRAGGVRRADPARAPTCARTARIR